jgi:two-component system cell cycle response regulator
VLALRIRVAGGSHKLGRHRSTFDVLAVAVAAGAAWIAFYAAWLGLTPGGDHTLLIFSDTAYLVPIAAAVAAAAWATARSARGLQAFWALLALACAAWLAGEVLWSVRELDAGEVPFPWWTDAAYLAFYVFAGAAFLSVFRPQLRSVGWIRLFEAGLMLGAVVLAWWWLVLRPLPLAGDAESLVALGAPTLALVLLAFLIAIRFLPVRHGTLGTALVTAGLACGTVSEGIYTHAVLTHGYVSGGWLELGWQAEAILYALGGVVSALGLDARPDWGRFRPLPRRGSVLIALAALTVAALVAAAALRDEAEAGLALAAVLGLAALARIGLLSRGSERPSPHLEGHAGRYGALPFQNRLTWSLVRARHLERPFALVLLRPAGQAPEPWPLAEELAESVDRLGDGTLALIVPDASEGDARTLAEELRADLVTAEGDPGEVEVGAAVWRTGDEIETLFSRARAAMTARS